MPAETSPGAGSGLPAVCTDHRLVALENGTGAARYAASLRRAAAQAGYATELLVDAAGPGAPVPSRLRKLLAALPPLAQAAPLHAGRRLAPDAFRRAQVHFDIHGRYLRLRGDALPALMHWSYPLPLHLAGVPNLYSVLDLIPLLQPGLTPVGQRRARRMLARLRHEADHLVTISEASRREIVATLGWPPERVTNTFMATDVPDWGPAQARLAAAAACRAAGVAPGGYFLHVGTVERRKNVARLVEAYRASGSRRALVLAGPDGWRAAEELQGAAGLLRPAGQGAPRVVRLGWTARDTLLGLVAGATAVLAPSLAEGFGLPAVEAMALGAPALTSRGGATEEITGGAALLVDPRDVAALADAIRALDQQPGLRASLAAAGRRRAQAFSPEAHAARLGALYARVLAPRPVPDARGQARP